MKREQSRAGSRFAECEKSRLKAKILITLALLLTAVTGAWAQQETLLTTITAADNSSFKSGSQTFGDVATVTLTGDYLKNDGSHGGWYCQGSNLTATISVAAANGANITSVKFYTAGGGSAEDKDAPFEVTTTTVTSSNITTYLNGNSIGSYGVSKIEVFGPAEAPITVEWNASTKTGTFSMPGSDVVLTPIYAKAAAFATTGTEPEVKTLLPTAIEGIFAGTTDAIVKAGTVAMMGKTENPQGIVMYAVTSINQATAPELSAFSATVPTAENIADEGADVLVWYYIQGANTPDGQEATAENTFNDSEIFAEPIKVTVLPNKYDIQFNAANANTIEAGKATVTVGGTAATVTEGKLQGVKMGSEVKVKANTGYKFRKVEVKKGAAGPKYADVVKICDKNGDNDYLISSFFDGTNANITTITKEEAIALAEYLGGGNILVVYEEYAYSGYKYVKTTNAAGNVTGLTLSITNTCNVPLYYVPAGN